MFTKVQALGFFLTYPQCPLEPHDVLESLRKCSPSEIKDYIVAVELHKDGNRHIHAFIRYERRVTWSATLWDITVNGKLYHGNYQQAKSWTAVIKYCCKETKNYISNVSVEDAKSKKAARNSQLLNEDPKQLISDGSIGFLQLPALLRSKALYTTLQPPLQTEDVRGIWVVGKTGVGKSHFVRSKFSGDDLYLKAQNKWWDGYQSQSVVLLDDFDHSGQCLGHYLKIWADKWGCTGEIKGGHVNLRHQAIYITSQYEIDDIWPGHEHSELRDAINRRFIRIPITEKLESGDIEVVEDN